MGDTWLISGERGKTNPFLVAATPLLTLMTQIKQCDVPPDISKLHQQIIGEIKLFSDKLQQLKYPSLMIDSACYCLCAALDEAVLATSWGTQSIWTQQSLLSLLRGETWGGERFYTIADVLAKEPRKYIFILEFIYVLLSLGFEGRYYGKNRVLRDEVRNRLFHKIRCSRGKITKALSINWRDERFFIARKQKRNTLKRLLCMCSIIFLSVSVYYNVAAYQKVKPVLHTLNSISRESPITAYSQLLNRPVFQHGVEDHHV